MKNFFIMQIQFNLLRKSYFAYIITVMLSIFGLQSCKYESEGFPDRELSLIPYNIGDSLHYFNGEDTIGLKVVDFYKTPPSSWHGLAMDVVYDDEYEGYYVTSKTTSGYFIREHLRNIDQYSIDIQITDNDIFKFVPVHDYPQERDSLNVIFCKDTIIESRTYYDVYKVSKTKMTDSQKISWIIKAKDKGIVQFYDRYSKKVWTLQE